MRVWLIYMLYTPYLVFLGRYCYKMNYSQSPRVHGMECYKVVDKNVIFEWIGNHSLSYEKHNFDIYSWFT
jgi:hypothetical protein